MPDEVRRPFRVLSIDGGGMRGLYTAALLNQLASLFSRQRSLNGIPPGELDIGSAFDLIVGTSTGGILASALTHGIPIKSVMQLYRDEGPKIFTDPMPFPLSNWSMLRWVFRNRRRAANSNSHLARVLKRWFGEETLLELYQRRQIALCIPAVKLIDEKARVFKTPHNIKKQMDNAYTLVDVCLATSAAPIYLPLVSLRSPDDPLKMDVFADGGLWANNPILIGLVEALEMTDTTRPIQILSIGTCSAPEGSVLSTDDLNRGMIDWRAGTKALSLSMNAQASGMDFMADFMAKIFAEYGKRIEVFRIPEAAPSTDQIPYLRLDLATQRALDAFAALGANDAVSAHRLIHNPDDKCGQMLSQIFNSMDFFPPSADGAKIMQEECHV